MTHPSKFNFTKTDLMALPLPMPGKRRYYRDTKESGLILDVRPSGSKSFYLYKKIDGRPERILIGGFPDLSVENARNLAAVHKGQIALGKNPQREKRAIRDEMTFAELFAQYMERYSKPYKKTWKQDEAEIKKYLSHFFARKISCITQYEIQRTHLRIKNENGLYQANKILCRIKAIYHKAIEWGWKGSNPAKGIRKFKETSRDRFLQPDELPRFFAALNNYSDRDTKDFIWLLLLTGSRKSKVMQMRWEQISWHRQEWHIPDTKNGDPLIVPLSEGAIEILQARWQKALNSAEAETQKPVWVFPSSRSKTGYIWCPMQHWKKLLKAAEIENLRLHDLRRTLGSYQAITGASLQIIGKSLGHRSPEATMIYARLHLDPIRASVEKATKAMLALSKDQYTNIAA